MERKHRKKPRSGVIRLMASMECNPKKPKSKTLVARFVPDDYDLIEAAAYNLGVTVSEYVRMILIKNSREEVA